MKKLLLLSLCATVFCLQSCVETDLNEDQPGADIHAVDKDKIERPGNQGSGG
jgi:hypothetical protein